MKRIITTKIDKDLGDGVVATQHAFQIQGEEAYTSSTITFKVYDIQNKLIKRNPTDPTTIISESVYFTNVVERDGKTPIKIPDSAGGNACGRTFPSWEGRKFTKEDQQTQSKVANYYTFLFGEATFPGLAPVIVNFRMPASIVKEWYNFQSNLGKEKAKWPSYLLELKAKKQATTDFTAVTFAVKQSGLEVEDSQLILDEISTFVQEHNNNISNR